MSPRAGGPATGTAASVGPAAVPGSGQTAQVPGGLGIVDNAADDTDNFGRGYGAGGYGAGASPVRRTEQATGVGTGYYQGVGSNVSPSTGYGGGPGVASGGAAAAGGAAGTVGAAQAGGAGSQTAAGGPAATGKAPTSDRIVGKPSMSFV